MLVDTIKVQHWMNTRKLTIAGAAGQLRLSEQRLTEILGCGRAELGDDMTQRLAGLLDVAPRQLMAGQDQPSVIVMPAAEMSRTQRPLHRDGIHFYNYYSMAAPTGHPGPVILDILCPADRLPALNNGHLEPAITVNLGPGDISGRWGEELTEDTWRVLSANRGGDAWIVGDSYMEPTYCPHSYARAGSEPARIISYTAAAPLAPLVEASDQWPDEAFDAWLGTVAEASPGDLLRTQLARRGYDPAAADAAAGLEPGTTAALLDGTAASYWATATALGAALGFDYRLLLPARQDADAVGKTFCSVQESRATVRRFGRYTVASMARAAHLTDLVGIFMLVDTPAPAELDLADVAESHYLVLSGSAVLSWREAGALRSVPLGPDDSAWVGPCVAHGWVGTAALAKLGSGRHVSYLDQIELSNTFQPRRTLRRARHDRLTWGYDGPRGAP
jgi:plasmid maintenance system antidote protein VapI